MANNRYKVHIPRDPTALIALLKKILEKHVELGTASPLLALGWDEMTPDLTKADTQDQLSDSLRKQAEKATGERDKYMPDLVEFVRAVRDVLLGVFRDNPDALGDFGFTVTDATSGGNATPTPTS